MKLVTLFRPWLFAVLSTFLAAPAWCATGATVRHAAKAPAAKTRAHATRTHAARVVKSSHVPGAAGLKAYLDPESGQIGMPPADAAALARDIDPLNDSDEGLVQVRMPDGHYMMDLQGRFADNMVVQVDPKTGKRVFRCVHNRAELMHPPVVSPAKAEDR